MIDPNFSFAVFAALTAYYVADSAWRLWRQRPAKYASVFGESLVAFAVVFVVLVTTPAPGDAVHVGAKVFIVAGVALATIFRLVARHRFAVES